MKRNSIKRRWKRVITAATAAALMVSSLGTLTAAAAEPDNQLKDAQVKVTKSFETNYAGEGAVNTFPELTFAFQFTADQVESSSKDDIPAIGEKSVTVPASASQESKRWKHRDSRINGYSPWKPEMCWRESSSPMQVCMYTMW